MPELVASHLRVRHGARVALDDVSLRAASGTLLAIVGPNGAGKTTLLRALLGLVHAEGAITVDGAELASVDARTRARTLAYVPQQSLLASPLPVEGVVALGRFAHHGPTGRRSRDDDRAIAAAMERVDVRAWADRPFTSLSLGEQRRVLVARALATDAPILLLDEPDAFLDVGQTLALFALLRSLRDEGRAIVVVLHGLDEAARSADAALLLDRGRTVAFGPTESVLAPAHVRRVFGVDSVSGGATGYRLPEAG